MLPRAPASEGRVVVRFPSSIMHGFVGFDSDLMDLGMNTGSALQVFDEMCEQNFISNFL